MRLNRAQTEERHHSRRRFLAGMAGTAGAVMLGGTACGSGSADKADPGRKAAWKFTAADGHWIQGVVDGGPTLYATAHHHDYPPGGSAYAIDAATGTARWTFRGETAAAEPLLVGDTLVYVGEGDPKSGLWYGLDAATGTERWRLPGLTARDTPPTVADGVVYATTPAVGGPAELCAFTAAEGRILWKLAVANSSVPAAATSGVLLRHAPDGRAIGVDLATGAIRWTAGGAQTSLQGQAFGYRDVFVASAWRQRENARDSIVALDALTGTVRWQTPPDLVVRTHRLIGDTVYYTTWSDVGALDAATGTKRWSRYIQGGVAGGASGLVTWATGPNALYVAAALGNAEVALHAFDTATGNARWHTTTAEHLIPLAPAVDAAAVYTTTVRNTVAALGPATGLPRWHLADGPPGITAPLLATPRMLCAAYQADLYAVPLP